MNARNALYDSYVRCFTTACHCDRIVAAYLEFIPEFSSEDWGGLDAPFYMPTGGILGGGEYGYITREPQGD